MITIAALIATGWLCARCDATVIGARKTVGWLTCAPISNGTDSPRPDQLPSHGRACTAAAASIHTPAARRASLSALPLLHRSHRTSSSAAAMT